MYMIMICCAHGVVGGCAGPYGREVMRCRPGTCAMECAGRDCGRGCAGWYEC